MSRRSHTTPSPVAGRLRVGASILPSRWSCALAAAAILALMPSRASAPESVPHVPAGSPVAMTATQAVILGLVEGLTEYLPVSSTGHLLVSQRLMGMHRPDEIAAQNAFAICIQSGAILAVAWLYRRRLADMVRGVRRGGTAGRRLAVNVLIAFAPAAAAGLLLGGWIKEELFGMWTIVAAWFAGGVAILGTGAWWRRKSASGAAGDTLETMSARQALLVGVLQCVAMWPGMSRSLMAIVGGLLAGLGLGAAVELSFLLGLVTLSAATALEVVREGEAMIRTLGWVNPFIGLAVAFVSAMAAIRWMVGYLTRHGLALFGIYRILIAAAIAWMLWTGRLA